MAERRLGIRQLDAMVDSALANAVDRLTAGDLLQCEQWLLTAKAIRRHADVVESAIIDAYEHDLSDSA